MSQAPTMPLYTDAYLADGWTRTKAFDGTHHGHHAVLMTKEESVRTWRYMWRWAISMVGGCAVGIAIVVAIPGEQGWLFSQGIGMLVGVPTFLIGDAWCRRLAN